MVDKENEITPGLSLITPVDEKNKAENDVTIPVKGVNIPGVGKVAGNVAMGVVTPEMLQNMQEMINQRTGGFKTFLDSMKDAVAITSRDPGSAMAARDQEKRLEQQSIFEMRNTMAALQAIKKQQEDFQARQLVARGLAPTGTASGAAPAQGAPGAAPTQVARPGFAVRDGVEMPLSHANALDNAQDDTERRNVWNNKILPYIADQEKIKTTANLSAERNIPKDMVLGGKNISLSLNDLDKLPEATREKIRQETFKRLGIIVDAPTAAPVQGNAEAIAKSLDVPIISGNRDITKQTELYNASQQPGYKGPPVAKPGTSQHEVGNAIDLAPNATEEHKQKLRDAGFVNQFPNDPNHWELRGAKQAPVAQAPAAPVVQAHAAPVVQAPAAPTLPPGPPTIPKPIVSGNAQQQVGNSVFSQALGLNKAPIPGAQVPAQAPSAAPAAQLPSAGMHPDGYRLSNTRNLPFDQTPEQVPYFNNAAEANLYNERKKDEQKIEVKDRGDFVSNPKKFETLIDEIHRARDYSLGHKNIFNLQGQHPMESFGVNLLHSNDKTSTQDQLASRHLKDDDLTAYNNVGAFATKIMSAAAADQAKQGGGRLTNMGFNIADKAKGIGPGTTINGHLQNLAYLEEEARTAQNQIDFINRHPNVPLVTIEKHPYFLQGAREEAKKATAKEYADLPGANYSGKDANGRIYLKH